MHVVVVSGSELWHSESPERCRFYVNHVHDGDMIEFRSSSVQEQPDRLTEVLERLVNHLTPTSTIEARHQKTLTLLERIATAVEPKKPTPYTVTAIRDAEMGLLGREHLFDGKIRSVNALGEVMISCPAAPYSLAGERVSVYRRGV